MPLDPQAATLLETLAAASEGQPQLHERTPEDARQVYDAMALLRQSDEPIAGIEDRTVPGPAGDIPIRIYRPEGEDALPVVVFFHGGGWVIGSIETHDALCRSLASRSGCAVVSVEYRLAPEVCFPEPLEDAYAATDWIGKHGGELGVDPGHLAVAGDSAGGNLAAAVCLLARDRGGPTIDFQLLVYPTLDHRLGHPSCTENAEGYFLTLDAMHWFSGHYLGAERAEKALDPYASPLLASDLRGVPAAHVITAEFDPLRDEGEAYAQALADADVPVTVRRYDGMIHGFVSLFGLLDRGDEGLNECASTIRAALKP
jgi:acetyl esterase